MIITNKEELVKIGLQSTEVTLDELDSLRSRLEFELNQSAINGFPGIGLAAPQIGIPKKMAIIRLKTNNYFYNVDLINCKIEQGWDPAVFQNEGCLSFPKTTVNNIRFQEIKIVNNLTSPHGFIATGLLAVAIQHELEHLEGKTFLDQSQPHSTTIYNR